MAANTKSLQEILDFTRFASVLLLLLHFYYEGYGLFANWGWHTHFLDQILRSLVRMGLLWHPGRTKALVLGLLALSVIGAHGRKDVTLTRNKIARPLLIGSLLYGSSFFWRPLEGENLISFGIYMGTATWGYLAFLRGGSLLSRLLRANFREDIFNEENETFPQEERLLQNEFSINLPARYRWKGVWRRSWINITNPFRGVLVTGSPGSGKSYFVIQHVIRQHLEKGFTMLVYDFKYDDLTQIAYQTFVRHQHRCKHPTSFYLINFETPGSSHRCNPLAPDTLFDITDATESARSILLGLNKDWIAKQGDFFVESPINFLTAIIWFLKKYEGGRFCTLPHVIELMQVEYDRLFPLLQREKEIEVLINPFVSAYQNRAMDQLEGQVASAKIGMARLASPALYWVMSGSDCTLDLNNPQAPKVLCLANNPQKQQVFGAVLSLYVNRVLKLVNRKDQLKCSLVFDEFPTLFINGIDSLIATARSNRVATILGLQDFSQLRKDYGREQAAVIMNITGNILSGQVMGETAKNLSERLGKIIQIKESLSINREDTSLSRSAQMDFAVPPSKVAALSSGEFVGMVADDPQQKIKLKAFHAQLLSPKNAVAYGLASMPLKERSSCETSTLLTNFLKVKEDIRLLIETQMSSYIPSAPTSSSDWE